jgi:hypothetical protein
VLDLLEEHAEAGVAIALRLNRYRKGELAIGGIRKELAEVGRTSRGSGDRTDDSVASSLVRAEDPHFLQPV